MKITESELLEALARSMTGVGDVDARTGPEISEATGIPVQRVRTALKRAQTDGRLNTHRVVRRSISGAQMIVVGYTITPAKKQKRA